MIIPAKGYCQVTLNQFLMKSLRAVQMFWLKITNTPRPSSYPFITGDSFRALAKHVHDETGTFMPDAVAKGDIVFVGNPYMKEYFETLHTRISHPYILIQHNGDFVVDQSIANFIDDKIICFFAQNTIINHPKIVPIPIGVTNKYWSVAGMPWTYNKKPSPHKLPRIFFSFSPETNPTEREPALRYLLEHSCADKPEKFLAANTHTQLLNKYLFVASPPGQGPESNRTWEALYMRTIPITKPFVGINYFKELGLPIWIVEDWHELDTYSEKELASKYNELFDNASFDALSMDYWIHKIEEASESLFRV